MTLGFVPVVVPFNNLNEPNVLLFQNEFEILLYTEFNQIIPVTYSYFTYQPGFYL